VTAAIDYSVFALVFAPARNILLATIAARAIAGLFNFTVGRSLVFRSRASVAPQAVKYALLVTALMWISYGLVTTFVLVLGLGVYVSKLLAESALFAASFALQNVAVFGEPRRGERTARRGTDWDAYYRRPALFAPLTRRITQRVVVREIVAALGGREPSAILELGGGNSPLLLALHARYPRAHLAAVDTNAVGLDLLAVQLPHKGAIDLVHRSVLAPATAAAADVVYSIGLIEHFDPADTARAVAAHFDYARPGGIVLMTFPMPTWLYRAVRAAAEALGIWRFPDERPLAIDEVTQEALRHGDLVRCFVNWPIVLTQGVLVLRKRGQAN
jgi:putative flippase GtrA